MQRHALVRGPCENSADVSVLLTRSSGDGWRHHRQFVPSLLLLLASHNPRRFRAAPWL